MTSKNGTQYKDDSPLLGIEQLRSIVRVINNSREDAFDDLTAEQILAACRTCWESGEWGYATPIPTARGIDWCIEGKAVAIYDTGVADPIRCLACGAVVEQREGRGRPLLWCLAPACRRARRVSQMSRYRAKKKRSTTTSTERKPSGVSGRIIFHRVACKSDALTGDYSDWVRAQAERIAGETRERLAANPDIESATVVVETRTPWIDGVPTPGLAVVADVVWRSPATEKGGAL